MSIRLVARDLYRLIRDVSMLNKQIDGAPLESQAALTEELRKVRAERDRLRRVLDGSKESLTKSHR